ncbi:MAG: helix-turn-helix transcriptional regulator [Pseudobacteriovorax sp.]|nr:helix-turn-helix transcriptional regulator [Pseudobacteriovorax sp.]
MSYRKVSLPYSENFGFVLKQWREESGFTQRSLAYSLGLSTPQMVSNWENGRCAPSLEQLVQLSKIFKVSKTVIIDMLVEESRASMYRAFEDLGK